VRRLPARQILTESVYEDVKERIMDLQMAPGSRINMDQLARQLQVSTTPLREALSRLESDGLVTRQSLRGYSVVSLPAWEDVLEMYNLRILLEPETARAAAAARGDDRLPGLLRATVGQMSELSALPVLAGHYQGYRALFNTDTFFHDTIAESSGNKLVRRTLASLHAHALLYRVWYHAGFATETVREHEAVIDAIAAHKPGAAAKAMRDHLERSRDRFLQVATNGEESLSGA
jgi:DNA-binding GntR family transcriptional regulator